MSNPCCTPGRGSSAAATEATPYVHSASSSRDERAGAVSLAGGRFLMGSGEGLGPTEDAEGPVREVDVAPFAIDACAVSNDRFAAFVDSSGYRTDAESYGWSHVFHLQLSPREAGRAPRAESAPWWCAVRAASWRAPEGPGSDLAERGDHPVTHVSWNDAVAYCRWAGGRLPTEIEWEYAARGGLRGARYPWGDELTPDGEHRCNIWQGDFPRHDTGEDGWIGTAPVAAYPANGFGLHNCVGNVWEWCADPWRGGRVIRGGSYLCHDSYCNRYRVAARSANGPDASSGNAGFRCVWDL